MAYQAAPYSELDYLTAILMGESGTRDDARAMGALADVVMNRVNGTQSPRTAYGDTFAYNPNTVAGQVTATYRGSPQFSSADRAQAQREGTGAAYDNYNNALTRGADAFSGSARERYNQARAVASSFLDQSDPNFGRYSGVSGGADFFVARGYPTYLRGGRYDSQTIGGSDFFKLKSNGGFTPWNDPGDRGVMNALPPAGSDLTGDGFDASQGAGSVGPGQFGMGTGVIETGNPYGFTGADASYGIGPGFNTLGNAVPYGNVSPLAFAGNRGFAGGVGPGSLHPSLSSYGPPPDPYGFTGTDFSGGVGPGALNPPLTTPQPDSASTLSPSGGTSTLGPSGTASTIGNPFATPTLDGGATAATIGPNGTLSALPAGFDGFAYAAANPDLIQAGVDPVQHYMTQGFREARALAPGGAIQSIGPDGKVRTHAADGTITGTLGAPSLTGTYPPPSPSQTFGPGGSINVMSSGLVPTQPPPDITSTFGPGPTITARTGTFNPDEYLRANADVAASGQSALDHFRNYGAREGRAIDTLGNHFNGDAYLAANRDVALAGLNPLEHFLRYGAQEARTLAPSDWASPLTATTNAGTYGAPAATQTLGPSGMTSTYGAPDPTLTIGPPALTGTYGPPTATPTLNPPMTMPSWSPFGGAGIGNPFGFSGANVGGGLGAGPQSFGSLWPVGSGGGEPAPAADPGGAGLGPFDFSSANVGGFDVNALGGGGGGATGPNSVNDMGISGGFDSEGAMRRVLEQQAADLRRADQAAKTPMHSDPNAFNVAIANGGNTVGMGTALQTPGAIGGPVVPNVTVRNYGMSAPGAMFSMFAPWR